MKLFNLLLWSLFVLILGACSTEPTAREEPKVAAPEPERYLYRPPVSPYNGLLSQKLKKEALAEAFVSRLSTKAPAGVVVLQHEKLVLEEYFGKDSTDFFCTGALFPAYVTSLLGSTYKSKYAIPYNAIPLENIYPQIEVVASSVAPKVSWYQDRKEHEKEIVQYLNKLIENKSGTTPGMAAEEFLFEPLQIDEYKWIDGSLCIHPHDALKLSSLWVRRGRWGNEQLLPDLLVQKVLAPAYDAHTLNGKMAYGWQYYKIVAKGRKQPLLYWKGAGAHLFLLPELEAVVLLQGEEGLLPEAWTWMQEYLIPSLTP